MTSVPSVPYAEAVLLLKRSVGRALASGEVARALYVSDRVVVELLGLAAENGVLGQQEDGAWRYQPRDEALAQAWDQFAACYAANLIGVTQLIHSGTHKSAQLFADAFKIRREP